MKEKLNEIFDNLFELGPFLNVQEEESQALVAQDLTARDEAEVSTRLQAQDEEAPALAVSKPKGECAKIKPWAKRH